MCRHQGISDRMNRDVFLFLSFPLYLCMLSFIFFSMFHIKMNLVSIAESSLNQFPMIHWTRPVVQNSEGLRHCWQCMDRVSVNHCSLKSHLLFLWDVNLSVLTSCGSLINPAFILTRSHPSTCSGTGQVWRVLVICLDLLVRFSLNMPLFVLLWPNGRRFESQNWQEM